MQRGDAGFSESKVTGCAAADEAVSCGKRPKGETSAIVCQFQAGHGIWWQESAEVSHSGLAFWINRGISAAHRQPYRVYRQPRCQPTADSTPVIKFLKLDSRSVGESELEFLSSVFTAIFAAGGLAATVSVSVPRSAGSVSGPVFWLCCRRSYIGFFRRFCVQAPMLGHNARRPRRFPSRS